jgi:hypothetical protein
VHKQLDLLWDQMKQNMNFHVREIIKGVHAQIRRTWTFVNDDAVPVPASPPTSTQAVLNGTGGQFATGSAATQEEFDFGDLDELFQHESIARFFPTGEDGEGEAMFDMNAWFDNTVKDNLDYSASLMTDSGYGSFHDGMSGSGVQ